LKDHLIYTVKIDRNELKILFIHRNDEQYRLR